MSLTSERAGNIGIVQLFDKKDNMKLKRTLVWLAIAAMATGITGNANPAGERVAARKLKPVNGKTLIGVYEPKRVLTTTRFERLVGKEVAVVHSFQAWSGPHADFDASWVQWANNLAKRGQVPMITWEPWKYSATDFNQPRFRLKKIARGDHDAYMRRWFAAVRDFKKPVFVRFAHEMNGFWYPWGKHVNSPRDYIGAWRHVVKLSREVGANNITWVWAPNPDLGRRLLYRYYPGNEYVDWVGVSGFNWAGPQKNWAGWRNFTEIFGPTLKRLKKYRKPIMIAEMGSLENYRLHQPGRKTKAAWIKDTFKQIRNSDPPIALVVWQNSLDRRKYDWRVSSSPASLQAMKKTLRDPGFSAKPGAKH